MSINAQAQPQVSAQSAILMNSNNIGILYEKDAYTPRPIASLTKIMTAIVALESVGLDDEVVISTTAANQPPSSCPLEAGDTLTIRQLLYCLILQSGNDAAWAIAEYVGGNIPNFVKLMNNKAQSIGMDQTNFTNPSGLDDPASNTSTAYAVALMMRYAMTNEDFRTIAGTKNYRTISLAYQITYNWNHKHRLVVNEPEVIAGKTGFTRKAGRTLVSVARRGNQELIAVTLNDPNDWQDHMNLFEYGFKLLGL